MNHKRRRPKNRRSGCLMCKSHKVNGAKQHRHGREAGRFSQIRNAESAEDCRNDDSAVP